MKKFTCFFVFLLLTGCSTHLVLDICNCKLDFGISIDFERKQPAQEEESEIIDTLAM